MKDEVMGFCLVILLPIVALTAIVVASIFLGHQIAELHTAPDRVRQEAIESGVGRWVIDPQTGEKTFEWGCE